MTAKRLSDVAYSLLREMITDLSLPPGSFINEQSLATQLEVGRMPVREALAQLAQDRFVTIVPRRGIFVTPLALDEVLGMFEAREAVECGIAYIAATRASEEDLAILSRLIATVDEARASTDPEKFLTDDHAVHTFLVHMIKNPLLQDAADRLLLHNLRFWRSYWRDRPPSAEAMLSHHELFEALQSHDSPRAESAMRTHLQHSRQLVQRLF
jgi:GntR family transcriptional regulator, rspAB operon transcriptional repressor